MIYRTEMYVAIDDAGNHRRIISRQRIDSSEFQPEFIGLGEFSPAPGAAMGFEFVVPGTTITEAFDKFDAAHADGLEDLKRQMDRQRQQEISRPKILRATNFSGGR